METKRLHEYMGPLVPILAFFDLAGVVLGAFVSLFILQIVFPERVLWPVPGNYQAAILIAAALTPGLLTWMGGYRPWRGFSLWLELRLICMAWVCVFAFFAVLALITKTGEQYSRFWLGLWFFTSLFLLSGGRITLRLLLRRLRKKGFDVKRIILVGTGDLIQRVTQILETNPWSGFAPVGYFSNQKLNTVTIPYMGSTGELAGYVQNSRGGVDQVWIAMPMSNEAQVRRLLDDLKHSTVDIRLVPDMFAYQLLNYSIDHIAGLPVLNISYSPFKGPERFIKELFDRVMAAGIILTLLPVMASIAFLIKITSPGPVLYKQLRNGWDHKPFIVYKFRTMRYEKGTEGGYVQAIRHDPRVTRFGRFLRATSLDELPQFFNVLQGDMSIVGPRPHPIEMNEKYVGSIDRYMLRHKVKPGITGWAQINGFRGETETLSKIEGRVKHDLYYIENWTLLLDIKIILLTLIKGFWHKNAY